MLFLDEIEIKVEGGAGGHGCHSFLREKFRPFGGPDGGNGGRGGSVYLEAHPSLNTLVDYHFQKNYKAQRGENGAGKMRSGAKGEDLILPVPLGTRAYASDTGEMIGDLLTVGQRLCVAHGGDGGFGNAHYKSSTNRSPRQFTKGFPGENRRLRLELHLLAEVGLLGLPNAGKSSLIRALSAATPKVADYPFTTLHPELGVVRVDRFRSFVMADLPGLIEGASAGVGLGIRFLKHLLRTGLLLHVVDFNAAMDDLAAVVAAVHVIEKEMQQFDPDLANKPRFLVLNKIDLIPGELLQELSTQLVAHLNWQGPVFAVSALKKLNLAAMVTAVMDHLEQNQPREVRGAD